MRTHERAATRVARSIVSDIRERALSPGDRLDPEHVMVEKQGVARGTVREALRFLELQGALEVKAGPRGGPVVREPAIEHLISALSLQLQFANATFRSVLEARRSIYPVLVAEAAENADGDDIAALHRCLDDLRSALDSSSATTREARRFYELIASASRNVVLGLLVNALHQMSEPSVEYDRPQREANLQQCDRMLQAIAAGDRAQAEVISRKTHAAARRYWETHAPAALNAPVTWMAGT